MLRTLSIAAALVSLAATLPAQTPTYPDTFKVGYYSQGVATSARAQIMWRFATSPLRGQIPRSTSRTSVLRPALRPILPETCAP